MPSEPPREWQVVRRLEPAAFLLSRALLLLAWLFPFSPALSETWSVPEQFHQSYSNGFVIGTDGQVLTSAQAVDGCASIQAKAGDASFAASIVARDADLALLKLDGPAPNGPSIRTTAPVAGEQTVTLQISLASKPGKPVLAAGPIKALRASATPAANDASKLQLSSMAGSGSPLFDLSGHVIGIVSGQVIELTSGCIHGHGNCPRSLALTSSVVQTFLDAQGISYKTTPEPPSPREVADIAEDAKGYAFLIECNKRSFTGSPIPAPVILYNDTH